MLRISSVAGIRQIPAKAIKQGLPSKLEVPVIIAFYAFISLLSRRLLNNRSHTTRTNSPATLTLLTVRIILFHTSIKSKFHTFGTPIYTICTSSHPF